MAGTLYLVSVGAGDPDWMTLGALKAIERCPVIAAPRVGDTMTALHIAEGAADLSGKVILPLDLPMSAQMQPLYDRAADVLCDALGQGDTAFLCLGDASTFASAFPIGQRVRKRGFAVETVCGVTSFSAAAAKTEMPIGYGSTPVQILPFGCEGFAERLHLPGTKVILKAGRHLPALCKMLEDAGMLDNARAVENCGMAHERIYTDLRKCESLGYFTVVIVHDEKGDA